MTPLPMPQREPARGHYADPAWLARPGVERMRPFIDGTGRPPAVHHLTGMGPTEAAHGRGTFALPASGWLANAAGLVPGGALALLADAPLGLAIESELPPGRTTTTSELSLNFVQPTLPGPGNLVARARLIHASTSLGLSSAEILDPRGRLVAYATTRCVVIEPEIPDGLHGQLPVDATQQGDGTPDPWQRPVEGEVLETSVLDGMDGLDSLRRWIDGELPVPPCGVLMGFRPTRADEGRVVWTADTTPWWSSPAPQLFGGALAWFAETAHTAAFQSVLPAGQTFANLDLKLQFLRPVFPRTGELVATAEIVHRGRSILVADVEVRDAHGKVALLGTGSAAVVPGGVRQLLAGARGISTPSPSG